MAFAEVADVEARLGRTLEADEAERVEVLLEEATDLIRTVAGGQVIYPAGTDTVTLSATGRRLLHLPQIPVTDVTDVTDTDGLAIVDLYEWNSDGTLRRSTGWSGAGDVTVTYTYGYADRPDALRRLCARLAIDLMDDDSDLRGESIGSYSVTYLRSASGDRTPLREADLALIRRFAAIPLP